MSGTWRVTEHRGKAGLAGLEADWRSLLDDMPDRSRYHAYEAHVAYLDNLCEAPDLARYLSLSDGSRVRAICPLEARLDRSLRVPVPVWALPWHPHWTVTDVVCPEDEARRVLVPAVVNHLRRRSQGRPVLCLGPLPEHSSLWDGLDQLASRQFSAHQAQTSAYFDCSQSYDELISRLTKHFRRNVRSHRNKVSRLPEIRFTTASTQPDLDAELEAFLKVEASGWKGESGTATAIELDASLVGFYRNLVRTLEGAGDHCEINSLHVEDGCMASQFCVRTGSEYVILKIGYDEQYARLGPGQVLLDRTLQRCCEDPAVKRLDLVADAPWCSDWQTEKLPMRQVHIALDTWRGIGLVALMAFRFGPARRLVGRIRAATESSPRPPKTTDPTSGGASYEADRPVP